MGASLANLPGFADAPRESQAVFRAVMNALARPGSIQALDARLSPPAPLLPELAAVALSLADSDAPLWLDEVLAREPAVAAWLRFHSGAPVVSDPAEAAFALVAAPASMPPLEAFAQGTEEFPDRSTTLVLAAGGFDGAAALSLEGPGIRGRRRFAPAPLPARFADQWRENRALFPRGVDLIFAGAGSVAGLPRSTHATGEE